MQCIACLQPLVCACLPEMWISVMRSRSVFADADGRREGTSAAAVPSSAACSPGLHAQRSLGAHAV